MRITRLRSFMARDGDRPRVTVATDTGEGITGRAEACLKTGRCIHCARKLPARPDGSTGYT